MTTKKTVTKKRKVGLPARLKALKKQFERVAPDFVPESDVQICHLMWENTLALEVYESLTRPTPQDERWVGRAFRPEDKLLRSEEHLMKAVNLGLEGAKADLARTWMLLGKIEQARSLLKEIKILAFSPCEHFLYLYALKQFEESYGSLRLAHELAEKGWQYIQGLPEFRLLAPDALFALQSIWCRLGKLERATYYTERWLELGTEGSLRMAQREHAKNLVYLGKVKEADKIIKQLRKGPVDFVRSGNFQSLQARLARVSGQPILALHHYSESALASGERLLFFGQFLAHLNLASVHAALGHTEEATFFLTQARAFPPDQLTLSSRLALEQYGHYVEVRLGLYPPDPHLLERLTDGYQQSEDLLDVLCCLLHLCDAERRLERGKLEERINTLEQKVTEGQSRYLLNKDWGLFPELCDHMREYHPRLLDPLWLESNPENSDSGFVHLYTLSQSRATLSDQSVSLPPKALELLIYLLWRGESRLERILCEVWADEEPGKARAYFHRLRQMVKDGLPPLDIAHDKEGNTYQLTSSAPLWWDYQELVAGRYSIPQHEAEFLPSSGMEWCAEVQAALENFIVHSPYRQRPLLELTLANT